MVSHCGLDLHLVTDIEPFFLIPIGHFVFPLWKNDTLPIFKSRYLFFFLVLSWSSLCISDK